MKDCLDEGRLQSFFDGELPLEMMEQAARHIAACEACAQAARAVETDNALFVEALNAEMSLPVPTEQLRTRITEAIAAGSPAVLAVHPASDRRFSWTNLIGFSPLRPQRTAAFAAILAMVLIGSIFAALKLKSVRPDNPIAGGSPPTEVITPPKETIADSVPPPAPAATPDQGANVRRKVPARDQVARVKLIPGEENYLRTIATLDVGMKQSGPPAMTPTNRAEYKRNLKLVDYAIAATRNKAKRAPHDSDAAELMFAAYQSKIDLLSSFSEQSRLAQR